MPVYRIAPSILAADFGRMAQAVQEAEAAGADEIHVDVMDGHFVPEISFGRRMVEAVRQATRLPLDVHLMVDNPARHIGPFAESGATRLTIHAEAAPASSDLAELVAGVALAGARAGVALKPVTSPAVLADVYVQLDHVLVMTVEPGYSGQPFMPEMLAKVRAVADVAPPHVAIAVDGGVDEHTIRRCAEAGATYFVAGSSVFSARRPVAGGIVALRAALR